MQKERKFHDLFRLQEDSGLSVREFCSSQGIKPSTYYYWHKKLKGKNTVNQKDFIPLIVKEPELARGAVCSGTLSQSEATIELVYPNGTVLRVKNNLDLDQLRSLIHLHE